MGQGRVTVHALSMQRAISMHAQLSLVQKNELFQEDLCQSLEQEKRSRSQYVLDEYTD